MLPNLILPKIIEVQGFNFSTIYLFYFIALIIWFFSIWYEGRRDGFDQEKLLDLSFIVIFFIFISTYFLFRYIVWLKIYSPYNFLLKLDETLLILFVAFSVGTIVIMYLCKFWNWSRFRLLDIYVSTISQAGFIVAFGLFLVSGHFLYLPLIILLPVNYFLILRLRSFSFMSGVTFSLFVFFCIPYIILFYKGQGFLYFCVALFTISIINFYFRWRKSYAGKISFTGVFKTVKRKTDKKTARS